MTTTLTAPSRSRFDALLLLVLCFPGLLGAAPPDCVPVPSGSVAWFPLDGTALDETSLHSGTLIQPAAYTASPRGQALVPGGGSIRIPNAPALQPATNLTVSAWVRGQNPGAYQYLLSKTFSTTYASSYAFYTGGGRTLYFYVTTDRGGSYNYTLAPAPATNPWDDRWHHVAGTYDGAMVRLYVDGREAGSGSAASGPIHYDNPALNGDLLLGNIIPGGPGNSGESAWTGAIDEVFVFERALSATEIGILASQTDRGFCLTGSPPSITVHPQSGSYPPNTTHRLSVTATGTPPLTYQWYRNGTPLPDATGSTLDFNPARIDDGGRYEVVVRNAFGAERSRTARLSPILLALPFHDTFALAGTLSGNAGAGTASNVGATLQVAEPRHADRRGGHSIWIRWQANDTGTLKLSTAGSTFDTLLALYVGATLDTLKPIASDDDTNGDTTSSLQATVTNGTTYLIAIDGRAGASGQAVLTWEFETSTDFVPQILQQPRSVTAAPGGTATFSALVASASTFRWYRNGLPLTDNATVSGSATPTLALRGIGTPDVGRYQLRINDDPNLISDDVTLELSLNLTGVAPSPTFGTSDKFADLIDDLSTLIDPRIGAAQGRARLAGLTLGSSGTQIFNTTGSSSDDGEPAHCGVAGGSSQWFAFQPENDGPIEFSTEGTPFDTVLAIYTDSGAGIGLFDGLVEVACNNDTAPGIRTSTTRFTARRSDIYLVAIDGVGGAAGIVTLHYGPPDPLQLIAAPLASGGLEITVSGSSRRQVRLDASSSLQRPQWRAVDSRPPAGTNAVFRILPLPSPSPTYYRAIDVP